MKNFIEINRALVAEKKSFLFVAALALTFAACNQNEPEKTLAVATFENIELAEESVYHLSATGTFESGDFTFQQDVQDYGAEYGVYYFGNIVSNKTSNTYDAYADSDKSAKGGAYEGKNFVVWTGSYAGDDKVTLKEAAVVPGFYVCNTPWVVEAILKGDGMSDDEGAPFGENDFFTLTITGSLKGVAASQNVEVDLAKGTEYIKDWTYVDLTALGQVDEIKFALTSSKKNAYGMTTPAYFAFDNLGAKK
ncbi:MAG: DUF4465 domain-containing protein [Paludibacteraceae bacterium]|nr:DUF4465 domain-containing protein [Paludibacteraceae bacterium]